MRVLIIGGGGREHALAWKLKQDDTSVELIAAPGNPGIAELAECIPIPMSDLPALATLARERGVAFTLVGPEAPLAAGIVDRFRAENLAIFGPTRAAAEIETSKAFSKQLMLEEGIPTARAEIHVNTAQAKASARRFGTPVVIKASGLAAGKGVIVCQTLAEADHAIDDILEGHRFGAAGAEVLIEEFMEGEELSVFAIASGTSFVMLPGLQDHKRLLDGDEGPNTGGMGAYAPVTVQTTDDQTARISEIIAATLKGLSDRGRPFTGLLYTGLMLTPTGPRVVEFNCRFGDPETQALLPILSLEPRLLDLFHAVATGTPLPGTRVALTGACVTTVIAAANYPDTPRTGDAITLPAASDDVIVFHAGTSRDTSGRLVTAGGRVLAVSAEAPDVEAAQRKSLATARAIEFAGKQWRSDIGWREIAREPGMTSARASGD